MSITPGFSGVLKLTNLDDFIAPSQECTKPVESVKRIKKKGTIEIEGEEISNSEKTYEKAKITLSDCLACSGCITSAEVILVNQQSFEQLIRLLDENLKKDPAEKLTLVLSLSIQSVLSFSIKHNLEEQEAFEKLIGYFRSIGVDYIFDTNFAQCFSILESQKEFIQRYQNKNKSLPLLASACPGWVCYAEKTHGSFILPHISDTRSPQHVMGSLVKNYWATQKNIDPSKIYHVTLMPCFDKKLEASREEFFLSESNSREVDCVITTVEVDQYLDANGIELKSMTRSLLDMDLSLSSNVSSFNGSGSGGYAHHIFCYAADQLFGIKTDQLTWKSLRNNDMLELTLEHEGETVLRFAIANGFRNIQNVVQKIKRNKSPYHYVEIMACPSGCLNGGAQIRPTSGTSSKDLVLHLETLFGQLPHVNPTDDSRIERLYSEWLNSSSTTTIDSLLHTTYKEIEKDTNPLGIKW